MPSPQLTINGLDSHNYYSYTLKLVNLSVPVQLTIRYAQHSSSP